MIASGAARRILLIGADAFSTILNPADRTTAAVFGDGAGAVVLRAGEPGEPGAVLGHDLGSDGDLADLITVSAGGTRHPDRDSSDPADRWFAMRGQAVYRHAVIRMTAAARNVMRIVCTPTSQGSAIPSPRRFRSPSPTRRPMASCERGTAC